MIGTLPQDADRISPVVDAKAAADKALSILGESVHVLYARLAATLTPDGILTGAADRAIPEADDLSTTASPLTVWIRDLERSLLTLARDVDVLAARVEL